MNKSELISAVAAATQSTRGATIQVIDAMIDVISTSLQKGEEVTISGFGTFTVRERAARKGRNPITGETIRIPSTKAPAFRPGKNLKDVVR
jgi:DNA-binding protein HU-beta